VRQWRPSARRIAVGFVCGLLLAWLAGCAQMVPQTMLLRTQWPAGVPEHVEMTDVPFFPQDDYQCGPAALATVLAYRGVSITPAALVDEVWLPSRQGSLQIEMLAAPRRHGRVSYALAPSYSDLLREVAAGNPVIVLQDVGPMFTAWHYAVVNGFDYPSGTIFLRSGKTERQQMPFTYFERTWVKGGYWAMVVTPPDRIPVTATEDGWIKAVLAMARVTKGEPVTKAYQAALERWPENLPAAIGLANQYQMQGALAQSATVLRAAMQRHPQSVIVMNNLAQVLSDQGRQTEALAQIDKASSDPKSPFAADVRSTRQLILQRMGQRKSGSR
jgi:hypothetical protein